MELNARIPEGYVEEKWENHLEHINLVGPNNRPKYDIIVVGSGLAGASAASSAAPAAPGASAASAAQKPRRAAGGGGAPAAGSGPRLGVSKH